MALLYHPATLGAAPLLGGGLLEFPLEKLLAFATGAGFAGLVALWHMFKTDKVISENTAALNELSNVLAALLRREGVSLRVGIRGTDEQRDK